MTFRFYMNNVVLFESTGDLTVSREVLEMAGMGENFEAVSLKVVGDVTELHFVWRSDKLTSQERQFIKDRKPILAIKEVRARCNMGLRDAKDVVDAYRRTISKEEGGL